ncbi:MAG TPA: hypothetical protein VEA69_09715 [Tepidisphaeraceae bacterium]|nr:hypothetical protein [Tepidisphaeraceae bacterium]
MLFFRLCAATLMLGLSAFGGGCVTSMMPGDLAQVQPTSDTARAGRVYLIRGWSGAFSWGIDDLARELKAQGVSAHVFQSDQRVVLAQTLVERYRGAKDPEPLCLIAHSQGSDDALFIASELSKANVAVDLLLTLDNVDLTTVSKNVRLAYHYWKPGSGDSNFLRGLPLTPEPGSTGRVINVNIAEDGKGLTEPNASHVTMDKDTKLRGHLVNHVLAACPERAAWAATRGKAGAVLLNNNGPRR